MKRKIVLGLAIYSVVFSLAGVYVIRTIRTATADLDKLITLHQAPAFEKELAAFEPFRYRPAIPTSDVPVLTDGYAPSDALIEPLVMSLYPTLKAYME